ncbi:MAG: chromate efflux transporter, partial [Rubritalea sp.]|uniref:chromate efflux transporter n=1 Tax=Rubritalea sp. TaxID=2109375 RepID=UPI0032427AB4
KHGWISEERFAELLALCQFLPGPASSQFGAIIGYEKGGWLGALGSWIGFTLPSAILMILLAVGLQPISDALGTGWIHGLKLAAVAIVALAVIGMYKKLCPGLPQLFVALGSLGVLLLASQAWLQPLVILFGGVVGAYLFSQSKVHVKKEEVEGRGKPPILSVVGIAAFIGAVCCLPLLAGMGEGANVTAGLLRAGSLVFGGGHVVLPLLESSFVGGGMMEQDSFLAGYGAAQAVPGPMFTLASYIGASVGIGGNPWLGGIIGTVAIFTPGMLLLVAGVPVWNWLKSMPRAKGAVMGANAAVVGLLAAALVHMFKAKVVSEPLDLVIVVPIFLALGTRKIPAWLAVLVAAVLGGLIWR